MSRREFLRRAGLLGLTAAGRRRAGRRGGSGARAGADDPEAGAGRRAGRRHLEVRPALLHLGERHPGVLQRLRQPDQPAPRPEAPSGAGHRVEGDRPHDLDVQAAAGRQVAQRRPVHRRRTRSSASSGRTTRRRRRWWRPSSPRSTGSRRRIRCTLVIHTKKPDPLLPARLAFYGGQIVPKKYLDAGGSGHVQRQAGRDGARAARLLDEGRQGGLRGDTRTTGAARSTSTASCSGRSRRTPPRVAALLKGEVDAMMQLPPDHWDRVNQNATTRGVGALYAGLYVPRRSTPRSRRSTTRSCKQAMSLAVDRESIVKEMCRGPGDRAQRADRPGRQALRRVAAAARLRPERGAGAAEEVRATRTSRSSSRPRSGTRRTTRRCPRRSRPCGRTWA